MRVPVKFHDATEASKFVVVCNSFVEDVNLYYKRYIIDAKSILGVLSCDFTEGIEVEILTESEQVQELFKERMAEFYG